MSDKLDLILLELKHLSNQVSVIDSKVTSLDVKVTTLESKVDSLETKVDSLEKKVASLDSRISVLESNQLTFLEELREMRLENQARDRIISQEFEKLTNGIHYVNRRVADLELGVILNPAKTDEDKSDIL